MSCKKLKYFWLLLFFLCEKYLYNEKGNGICRVFYDVYLKFFEDVEEYMSVGMVWGFIVFSFFREGSYFI